ncbi:hypothetical protein B296_00011112 [Ensete ventricosum]|uniref:Uncharacterized protein n=1 Tax=Ensete ventricosum TaxID=4639 RepID=A0A427AZ39_ENSVE|nr:hypothetical protein B296_00011112 [Ensete ventricosum]
MGRPSHLLRVRDKAPCRQPTWQSKIRPGIGKADLAQGSPTWTKTIVDCEARQRLMTPCRSILRLTSKGPDRTPPSSLTTFPTNANNLTHIVEPLQLAPWSAPQQMQPELPLTWEDQPMPQPDLDGQQHFSAEVRLGTLSTTDGRSMSPPRGSTPTSLELDTFSSDSADLLRAQLRRVNQRLDKVQKEFVKSKEELRESSKDGSPFVPEI